MTDNLLRLPTGHMRLSRIVYLTDLMHSDSREIQIGVVAEVTMTGLRGIGTALRPTLGGDELTKVGPFAATILNNPMRGLWQFMLDALACSDAGRALEALSGKFSSSLSVLTPEPLPVPRKWLVTQPDRLENVVREDMKHILINAYYDQLFPGRSIADPSFDEHMLKKSA